MTWYKLAQSEWWKRGANIKLFHGTSSELMGDISEHGLQPPGDFARHCSEIAERYFPRGVPEAVERDIRKYVIGHRDNDGWAKDSGHKIYLSTSQEHALKYARSYAKTWGELGHEIWRMANYDALRVKYRGKFDANKWDKETLVPPLWPKAEPIVLEVEIPYAWVSGPENSNVENVFNSLREWWDRDEKQRATHRSFDEFVDGMNLDLEVHCPRPIPPEMIKRVQRVG